MSLTGFNARRDLLLRAKVAFAHPTFFPVQGGDGKRAGQQAGTASHTGFRVMLHSLSAVLPAEAAGNTSLYARG